MLAFPDKLFGTLFITSFFTLVKPSSFKQRFSCGDRLVFLRIKEVQLSL